METLFRILATLCAIMVIGTVGGMEYGTISIIGGLIRCIGFCIGAATFHSIAEYFYDKRKRP